MSDLASHERPRARSASGPALASENAPGDRPERLLAVHGRTFHFATRFFPARYRRAVISLYAFFRTLDDLVDERTATWEREVVQAELTAWQHWFQQGCPTPAPREPLGSTLAALLEEFEIPVGLFLDFLAGLATDLEMLTFSRTHELYHYCYQVAGTVGLAMAHVLGAHSQQALTAARDLGIAMQLTNILRDVGRDLQMGRLYLPADELERFALSPALLRQIWHDHALPDERFTRCMRWQLQRARAFYARGLHGVWLLNPDCRLPILLAGRLYQRILNEIERQRYEVLYRRAATSWLTKVREAGVVVLLTLLWGREDASLAAEMELLYEND